MNLVTIPVEPPYPTNFIIQGVRTVNGKSTVVYYGEDDNYPSWNTGTSNALKFSTREKAEVQMKYAKSCDRPWYNEPDRKTLEILEVDTPQRARYRQMIQDGLKALKQ